MRDKPVYWEDTIVALATPPGVGAIGVVRLSGRAAFALAGRLFPAKNLQQQRSHTLHVGYLVAGGRPLDEVVLSLYRGPRSYTGEDVVEISCHGSPFVLQQVIEACVQEGARPARPGEFTQRAFLNGKLDLAQAEAVADLIASSTQTSRDTALHAMRGGFSAVLSGLREQMLQFSALIELELDFAQEDVEFADRRQFYQLLHRAADTTRQLIDSFRYGNVIKNGVRVAIIGRPNAGKSTLLNSLLNENRAIVSEIAGTTRDTIEEVLNLNGILFRLIDTAGLREEASDSIEIAGMARTREKIREADLVLYVFDVNTTSEADLAAVLERYGGLAEGQERFVPGQALRGEAETSDSREALPDAVVHPVQGEVGTGESAGADLRNEQTDGEGRPDVSAATGVRRLLLVGNKTDINGIEQAKEKFRNIPVEILFISARQDRHLPSLKQEMFDAVVSGAVNADDTVVTNARHYAALQSVQQSLHDIIKGLDAGLPGDLLALDIRRCLHYLGEITGEITNDEQLGYIFSKFCIGK